MAANKETTEVRQYEIAKAALEIISKRGLKGLSMVAIAKKVGIVPSAIYRHFDSKEDVIDAILDFLRHSLHANAREASAMEGNALELLHALLEKHLRMFHDNEAIPVVVFSSAIYAGNPRRRVKVLGIVKTYLADIAAIVEQGQSEGTIRAELDPKAAAVSFLGMILPSATLWHVTAGDFDIDKQAEAAWPMFRRSIETTNL